MVSGLGNLLGLASLAVDKKAWNPSLIPEAALFLADLVIAGLHPFSGTAAFYGKWVWGPGGCQSYAFFGFLAGNYALAGPAFVILDRVLLAHDPAGLLLLPASSSCH